MEELLTKLLSTAFSPLIEALNRNSSNLERVIAGQEAAMAKLETAAGGATTRTRRSIKATDAVTTSDSANLGPNGEDVVPETKPAVTTAPTVHTLLASANGETKKNAKNEDEPTGNYRAGEFSRQEVKNEFIGWLGDTTDANERKARAAFVGEVAQHFGVQKPFDPTNGITDPEQLKQTLFFLRRKRDGLKVDFSADYDFDGDPLADQTLDVEPAAEEDPLG